MRSGRPGTTRRRSWRWSTRTAAIRPGRCASTAVYGKKDSYAAKANYDGGYFDPPIDFAKEAEAAGAYGENVTDPAQIEPALRRGLKAIRRKAGRR